MIAMTLQEQLEARFSAHRADAAVLRTIEQELQRLNDPWAGKLRLRVIHARIQLRYGRPKLPTPGWCGQFGLQPPDGRPLYRYRIDQAKFERIQNYLKQQARPNGYARPGDQALFVLWAAEWFRRVHQGGIRKWEDVGQRLGLSLSQATWRELADAGLKQWKLRPLRLHGSTQRLLSLSRQGGFPLAAVEGDGNAWAARYLKRLVSILLGQPNITTEIAFEHARSLAAEVKESWQHDEFYVVSADLAQSIIALRREAEHAGLPAGLPPSVWLDQCRPEWRDELPLTIDSDAGRKLIDGLLSAEASRARGITVRATRFLRASGGTWHPWARMDLNGSLRVADADRLAATWSRLRLFASGKLARYLADELAIVEPENEGIWLATPRRASTEAPVPFDVPIEAELRGGGERIGLAFVLKDGEPVHRPLLVCRAAGHEGAEDAEDILELLGTSSGAYRADTLFIAAPASWRLQSESGDEYEYRHIGKITDGRSFWRVTRPTKVVSQDGDEYRFLPGQDNEARETLLLSGSLASGVVSSDGRPIYLGAPQLELNDRGKRRAAQPGELWCRPTGERNWRPLGHGLPSALGQCDLAWRKASGLIYDRHAVIILPPAFDIRVTRKEKRVEISVTGWPGSADITAGIHLKGGLWLLEGAAAQAPSVTIMLSAPGAKPVQLEKRLPQSTHIRSWDRGQLPSRSQIALADLHRYVACGHGRGRLLAQLRNRRNHQVEAAEMRWVFDDELPLNVIRDDLTSLLRPMGELDARIELSFEGVGECWYVEEFATTPAAAPEIEPAHLAGRALHNPTVELDFGEMEGELGSPPPIPDVEGTWLRYLRRGERVLTRPTPIKGKTLATMPESEFARAMAIADRERRFLALDDVCHAALRNDDAGRSILSAITALAGSLHGLPPSTFDVFVLLTKRNLLAMRLLFAAKDDELQAVLALEAGLPFAWCLIPRRDWEAAGNLEIDALMSALSAHTANPAELAVQAVAARSKRIVAHAPILAPLLNLSTATCTLTEARQNFLRSEHDRTDSLGSDLFRRSLAAKLPHLEFDEAYWRALDAPCAAALAARGEAELDEAQVRGVKDTARRFPRYFQDAFAAMLRSPARA